MDKKINSTRQRIQDAGDVMVDLFHYIALFVIGATVVWSAVSEYLVIMQQGHAGLKDILLLFIYLELGAMIGIYFKTHRLPVQFLIYVAITALARHLVIDVQKVTDEFHIWLILAIVASILVLSLVVLIFAMAASKYGRPEEDLAKPEDTRADF